MQLSIDLGLLDKEANEAEAEKEVQKLVLASLARPPTEWKDKRYRRLELATNEQERAQVHIREWA